MTSVFKISHGVEFVSPVAGWRSLILWVAITGAGIGILAMVAAFAIVVWSTFWS